MPPFSSDKQVLRRSGKAYGKYKEKCLAHYLHDSEHRWRVGDVNEQNPNSQMYIRVPIHDSEYLSDNKWQIEYETKLLDSKNITFFDWIQNGFDSQEKGDCIKL